MSDDVNNPWSGYQVTKSGITLVTLGDQYADVRAWVKLRGEPSLRLYCNPDQFAHVYDEFSKSDALYMVACDFLYGLPQYFFRHMVAELVYVGMTMASKVESKPVKGSIWLEPDNYPEGGVWVPSHA